MSNLKFKSVENLAAAQNLINQRLYNPSVHCSYYGCLQLMKCMLCYKLNISYDKQNDYNGMDTHTYIRNLIYNNLNNRFLKQKFLSDFNSLKVKRRKADYINELITENECLTAMEETKRIITYLKTAFGTLNLQ
jgi:uncharacterized protein (UPF0332 family)